MRFMSAFVVLISHARGYLFVGGRVYLSGPDVNLWDKILIGLFQITSLGPNAVIVFFVLSGFSIAHSVAHGGSAGRFYQRRVIRLVPPCLGGLALGWVAFAVSPDPSAPFRSVIPQYWSLHHEAIFYALAPLVVAVAWRRHFAAAAMLGYAMGLGMGEGSIAHNFVFHYAFYFAVGVMAYHQRDMLERLALSRVMFGIACTLFLVAMAATFHTYLRVSLMFAAAFSLVLISNFLHHRITKPAMQWLGAMSYTLYLTHYAAIVLWALLLQQAGWLQGRASSNPWLWTTAVPFCLTVSFGFYWAIERPAMRTLDRMRERRSESAEPLARA